MFEAIMVFYAILFGCVAVFEALNDFDFHVVLVAAIGVFLIGLFLTPGIFAGG